MLRTTGSNGVQESLRRAVARTGAEIPVPEVHPLAELIGKSAQQRRFQAELLCIFALTAVLLAGIGVYGVVAYSVLQRRREIGLRVALGADARRVTQLVFKNGMTPVFAGMVAGVAAASLLSKVISSLLFNTSPLDPITYVAAPVIIALAGAVPCWLSARQTLRIDPAECLRVE